MDREGPVGIAIGLSVAIVLVPLRMCYLSGVVIQHIVRVTTSHTSFEIHHYSPLRLTLGSCDFIVTRRIQNRCGPSLYLQGYVVLVT